MSCSNISQRLNSFNDKLRKQQQQLILSDTWKWIINHRAREREDMTFSSSRFLIGFEMLIDVTE